VAAELQITTAERLCSELASRHGALVTYKNGLVWESVARGFDLLRVLGLRVPSGAEFVGDYWTTVGIVIARGTREPDSGMGLLSVMAHECRHVVQFLADPARFPLRYLGAVTGERAAAKEPRATYESEAISDQYALEWAMTGVIPARDHVAASLVYGYDLSHEDVELARGLCEQRIAALQFGLVPPGPARTAIALLAREVPECLDHGSLALLRANCPEALVLA
jgi:hypothetical protein